MFERQLATKSKDAPIPVLARARDAFVERPVERSAPVVCFHGIPSGGEPELRFGVAAVSHEGCEFGTGDETVGELKRLKPDAMTRKLVVKTESIAGVANFPEPAGKSAERNGRGNGS